MLEMHEKYGPIVRVSPGELAFCSPAAFKDIYGRRKDGPPELAKDKKHYSGMGEPTLLNSDDMAYHSYLRKLLSPSFSDFSLRKQEAVIQDYLKILMRKLEKHSQDYDGGADLLQWFNVSFFHSCSRLIDQTDANLVFRVRCDWIFKSVFPEDVEGPTS